jgi:uncharacterized protein YggE
MRPMLAALTLVLAAAPPALAQDRTAEAPRRIVVSGDASAEAAPDRASFTAGVQAEARGARDALRAASGTMTQVLAALEAAGVAKADLQTSELSVDPLWDDGDGGQRQPQVRGYMASNLVTVRSRDLAALGALIDAASEAGANRFMGLSFDLADPAAQEAEARAAAVAEARARAEQLASAAGVRLGPVLSITEQGGAGPMPMFARAEAMPAPPVAPGSVGVTVSVEVVYGIE